MNLSIFGNRNDLIRTTPQDGEQVIAIFGSTKIDLSQIRLPETLNMSALAMFGNVKLIVPRGTEVVFRGFALFGSQNYKARSNRPVGNYRSVIYLNSVALFGSIDVIEAYEA